MSDLFILKLIFLLRMDFFSLQKILEENTDFIITCHVNPDADAIGSELAVYDILTQIKKNARIINYSKTPYNLEFLDSNKVIEKYDPGKHDEVIKNSGVIILLDLNQLSRTVKMENAIRNSPAIKVCIDHHTEPENFSEYMIVDNQYSSTGEIIYDFLDKTEIAVLNHNIATQLYAAIMTDTGSFRFERTTPELHRKVANLLEQGVSPYEIYDQIYAQFNLSRNKLLGHALASLELSKSGKIAYMTITQDMLKKTGAFESDVDGFVNYCLEIKGVEIGMLFFELKDGVKVSFRSKLDVPVNKLAEKFKGGGHFNASGTRLFNVKLNEIQPQIVESAEELLRNNKN